MWTNLVLLERLFLNNKKKNNFQLAYKATNLQSQDFCL